MVNVLIVDDEPLDVLLLKGLLEDKYSIKTANNGNLACKMVDEMMPDIILLNIIMPEMNGLQILKNIKSNKQLSNIIVIMMAAKLDKKNVAKSLSIGADDYVRKPIDATELYTKINLHLKIRKLSNQVTDYQTFADISESMISAQRIQSALLPDRNDFSLLFPNSFTLYQPRDMVGGDLYFASKNKDKTFLCVSDSTGHGVPAAMLSMLTYMALNFTVNRLRISNPAKVADNLARELTCNLNKSTSKNLFSLDLNAVFCEFDFGLNTLTYSNIKRPIVIIRKDINYILVNGCRYRPAMTKNDYHLFYIHKARGNVGKFDTKHKLVFHNNEVQLMEGDTIYMFSDGVTDQFGGPRDKKFTKKRFLELLLSCQGSGLKFQKLQIYQTIEQWMVSMEQTDDIVIIGIKV